MWAKTKGIAKLEWKLSILDEKRQFNGENGIEVEFRVAINVDVQIQT